MCVAAMTLGPDATGSACTRSHSETSPMTPSSGSIKRSACARSDPPPTGDPGPGSMVSGKQRLLFGYCVFVQLDRCSLLECPDWTGVGEGRIGHLSVRTPVGPIGSMGRSVSNETDGESSRDRLVVNETGSVLYQINCSPAGLEGRHPPSGCQSCSSTLRSRTNGRRRSVLSWYSWKPGFQSVTRFHIV